MVVAADAAAAVDTAADEAVTAAAVVVAVGTAAVADAAEIAATAAIAGKLRKPRLQKAGTQVAGRPSPVRNAALFPAGRWHPL